MPSGERIVFRFAFTDAPEIDITEVVGNVAEVQAALRQMLHLADTDLSVPLGERAANAEYNMGLIIEDCDDMGLPPGFGLEMTRLPRALLRQLRAKLNN